MIWTKYKNNKDGNIAMMFGVACFTLVIAAAAGIDYTAASSRSGDLQDISDAAVLAAAISKETDQTKLQNIVDDYIAQHNTYGWPVTAQITLVDDVLRVEAQTTYDTVLLGIVGTDMLDIGAFSEAPLAEDTPLHVALVLDTTDSMNIDDKIGDLKSAADKLVDKLVLIDNNKIRMSVVPFSSYVNVGTANRNASWIDVPADYSYTEPAGTCYMHQPRTCTGGHATETRTRYKDGVPHTYDANICQGWSDDGAAYEVCPSDTTVTVTWEGCAGSRNNPFHKRPEYGVKKIPAIMDVSNQGDDTCGTKLLPLTNDLTSVKTKIDGLTAAGVTYIPSGLIWGWRTLEKTQPFNEASFGNQDDVIKAMIVMSDGGNSVRLDAPKHIGDKDNIVDTNTLTSEICDGIANDGTIIYTVAYKFEGAGSAEAKTMLQNCASAPGNFFDPESASALEDTFERIGNELFSVRLSL